MIMKLWRWFLSLFRRAPKLVPRTFYGMMFQGELLATPEKVTTPFGTLRVWNNGASYEWVNKNDWQGFDIALNFAQLKGAEVLYVLAGEPDAQLPAPADWCEFVTKAVVRAAGRIKLWELWNEPVYCSGADPGQVWSYASAAYSIIKKAQPDAIVLSPSFNELGQYYARNFAQAYIDTMAAMGTACDAIAFHSYSTNQDGDRQILLALLAPHNLDLPLYLTETVATPEAMQKLAGKVECVVQNGQIQ